MAYMSTIFTQNVKLVDLLDRLYNKTEKRRYEYRWRIVAYHNGCDVPPAVEPCAGTLLFPTTIAAITISNILYSDITTSSKMSLRNTSDGEESGVPSSDSGWQLGTITQRGPLH